jgi:peptidoglycan/xylan/chitin deacetylase (PgdA/CDA1 family)
MIIKEDNLFRRKIYELFCYLISYRHRDFLKGEKTGYLTIFHDYEGEYAGKDLSDLSYKGVTEILRIEKKFNINATFNIVGRLINDVPKVVEQIITDGHELASHSYSHNIMSRLSKDEIRLDIELTRELFNSLGVPLRGFRSPESKWNFAQINVLFDEAIMWSAEGDKASFPYVLKQNGTRQLIRLPITMDDWSYRSRNMSPEDMYDRLIDVAARIAKNKCYGAIGFHPWVQAQDENRLKIFEQFIDHVIHRNDLKVLTFSEMHDHFMMKYK